MAGIYQTTVVMVTIINTLGCVGVPDFTMFTKITAGLSLYAKTTWLCLEIERVKVSTSSILTNSRCHGYSKNNEWSWMMR